MRYSHLQKTLIVRFRLIVGTCILALLLSCTAEKETSKDTAPIEGKPVDRPTLKQQLADKKAAFLKSAPQEMIDVFELGVREVKESGVVEAALNVGDTVPEFTLPNGEGEQISLSNLLRQGPVVIAWYRGGWCPYCNLELVALQDALPEITAAGGQLVAISPEIPDSSLSTKEKSNLGFEVLSDTNNIVARQFGIVYTLPEPVARAFEGRLDLEAYNANSAKELPLAVTYVIDTQRVIRYAFVDGDYRVRAEPADIFAELKKLK